jgi:hypothetical protein
MNLGFSAEADVVVEIESIEPGLDVLSGLAVLADVFGKAGKSLGITVGAALVEVGGPGFNFPGSARCLGVLQDPGENFSIALAGRELLQQGLRIKIEETDKMLVGWRVVVVRPVLADEFGATLVKHAWQDGETAQAGMKTARRALSQVGKGYVGAHNIGWLRLKRGLAAIDGDGCPADEGCFRGREKNNGVGDFLGKSKTLERHSFGESRLAVV